MIKFVGQVVDSLATPLAGWAIDHTGYKKLWHLGGTFKLKLPKKIKIFLAGTICVAIGFVSIFSLQPTEYTSLVLVYYITVITLFQIGWAVVQISHLCTIPEMSRDYSQSSDLTTIR